MDSQLPPIRPGFNERAFKLKSVIALSLGSLILGGIGGATLGVVSADSDTGPTGQPGQPRQPGQDGQLGRQDQPGQPGQPLDGPGSIPPANG